MVMWLSWGDRGGKADGETNDVAENRKDEQKVKKWTAFLSNRGGFEIKYKFNVTKGRETTKI